MTMTTLASSYLRNRVHREIGELLDPNPSIGVPSTE
jgi:hypothetical protein